MKDNTPIIIILLVAIIVVSGLGLMSYVYLNDEDSVITGYVVNNVPKNGHYLLSFSQEPIGVGTEVARINVMYADVDIPSDNTHIKMWFNIIDNIMIINKIEYL